MIERDIATLISIFCDVDDFCKEFEPEWKKILIENRDKGYISQELFLKLYDKGLQIITRLKKNMKNKLMSLNLEKEILL